MTIDEILKEWKEDSKIGVTNIDTSGSESIKLHAKYMIYLREAAKTLRKYETEVKIKANELNDYYSSRVKDASGKTYPFRLDKSEIKSKVESNPHYIEVKAKEEEASETVSMIKEIITSINKRSYILKTMVEYQKFKNGLS